MRPIFSGSARPVVSVNDRAVPVSRTEPGMMLNAVPPWIEPMVTTAASSGEISRDTTVCSASTMRAAATMGSAVSCGAAPCPPRPSTSISKWSTAAMSAPRLMPILPTGRGLQRWRPNAAPTPSSTPSSAHACAPPWPSSAGWKRKRIGAPGLLAARRRATASPIATWPSCPHACMRPGIVEA